MNLRVVALSSFAIAVFVSGVFADMVEVTYLSPFDATTEKVSINYGSYNFTGTVYTGLYNITVDGTRYQTFCIDPLGDIRSGDTWTADHLSAEEITAGNGELFTSTYPNTDLALEKYAMIDYLAEQSFYLYTDSPDPRLDTKAERSDLSLLYWEIALDYDGTLGSLNLGSGHFSSSTTSMNSTLSGLLSEAYSNKDKTLAMSIYSPIEKPSQEFLAFKPTSVPEPGIVSLFLLGFSAIGFSGIFRRKR